MPHTAPSEWAQEALRLNRTWKVSILYTWLVDDSTTCFSILHFIYFSSCLLGFFCTLTSLLSLSQCRQPSAPFSTQLRKTCMLWRNSRNVLRVLHCQEAPFFPCPQPPLSVHVTHEFWASMHQLWFLMEDDSPSIGGWTMEYAAGDAQKGPVLLEC